MIAKARAVSHGNAYTTYSTLKKDAEFIGTLNMDCDAVLSLHPEEDAWEEFKNEDIKHKNMLWEMRMKNPNFAIPKKEVTRTLIAMEVSPTKEESEGWTKDDWFLFGREVLAHMDNIELKDKDGNVSAKKTNLQNSKVLMMLHHDAKSGIPHLHFMISRFDNEGFTNCSNLIGLKATIAANQINEEQGWKQSREISEEHKAEIKNACYDVLRSMRHWDLNHYFYKLEERGYKIDARKPGGNVVSYSIIRGNSRYTASSIGANLTVAKLRKAWEEEHEKIRKTKDAELKERIRAAKERDTDNHGTAVRTENKLQTKPSYPMVTTSCQWSNDITTKVSIPKFILDTLKENIDLPDESDYENEENGIPKIVDMDKAVSIAVGILFEMMFPSVVVPTSSGGGGSTSHLPWNDNDEDEWKEKARLAAQRASAKCTPKHSKPIVKTGGRGR